jgi:DNA replication protein DnaC
MLSATDQKNIALELLRSKNTKMTDVEIEAEYEKLQKRLTYPPRYENVSVDDIPKQIGDLLVNLKDKTGLYIWGDVGTGKTHTLYALRKYFGREIRLLRIYNFADILQSIRDSYNDDEKENIITYVERFSAFDDIGAEKETEWAGEQLYRAVDYLYLNKLPFIFTSNLNLKELAGRYGQTGDRIASRIAQMAHIVEIGGKDRRI